MTVPIGDEFGCSPHGNRTQAGAVIGMPLPHDHRRATHSHAAGSAVASGPRRLWRVGAEGVPACLPSQRPKRF